MDMKAAFLANHPWLATIEARERKLWSELEKAAYIAVSHLSTVLHLSGVANDTQAHFDKLETLLAPLKAHFETKA